MDGHPPRFSTVVRSPMYTAGCTGGGRGGEAAEAAVLEEWEAKGADSDEPDPDKFTDPWDESYNAMDDYWYY